MVFIQIKPDQWAPISTHLEDEYGVSSWKQFQLNKTTTTSLSHQLLSSCLHLLYVMFMETISSQQHCVKYIKLATVLVSSTADFPLRLTSMEVTQHEQHCTILRSILLLRLLFSAAFYVLIFTAPTTDQPHYHTLYCNTTWFIDICGWL